MTLFAQFWQAFFTALIQNIPSLVSAYKAATTTIAVDAGKPPEQAAVEAEAEKMP